MDTIRTTLYRGTAVDRSHSGRTHDIVRRTAWPRADCNANDTGFTLTTARPLTLNGTGVGNSGAVLTLMEGQT